MPPGQRKRSPILYRGDMIQDACQRSFVGKFAQRSSPRMVAPQELGIDHLVLSREMLQSSCTTGICSKAHLDHAPAEQHETQPSSANCLGDASARWVRTW